MKILTVDDSKAIRMLVKKTFAAYDCEILEAANGLQCLESVERDNPDLIIMDITMPEMSGTDALHKIREMENGKDTPVIILTATAGPDTAMEVALLGVRDVIPKPFDREDLLAKAMRLVSLKSGA